MTRTPRPNRRERQRIAEHTVAILRAGRYHAASGAEIVLTEAIARAVDGTVLHAPDHPPARAAPGAHRTVVTLANETTLAGARWLRAQGHDVAALVFASARHPGGGFLSGAEAQEESLARASALYACQLGSPFYEHHRDAGAPAYSHHVICSPDVPVFRDDGGALLDAWWPCSFLTAAAVNCRELDDDARAAMTPIMRARITRILDVAAAHGHRALVLGAFGCGVFRNDPDIVAALFAEALASTHAGVFEQVRFSVYDAAESATWRAFETRFGDLRLGTPT